MEQNNKEMVLCISGMAGSGKSTLSKRLAEVYKLEYHSGGDALKRLAYDMGYKTQSRGWWESDEGISFLQKRAKNLNLDLKIDSMMIKWGKQGGVVLDSWVISWIFKDGFKIWLEASKETRTKRIAERDNISFADAKKFLQSKERRTKLIFKKLYGFSLGENFEPFNLILDVNILSSEEVFQVVNSVIDETFRKSKHLESICVK